MFEIAILIGNIIVWIGIVILSGFGSILACELDYLNGKRNHFFIGIVWFLVTGGVLITIKALVVKFYTWLF